MVPAPDDPIARFLALRARAARAVEGDPAIDPTTAALATADAAGRPSVRFVLVKLVDARGFTFFTHRDSRKGAELAANPHAALAFHWPALAEQVRVEGPVEPIAETESDAYFAGRPRESQVGAWASAQSRPIPGRAALEVAVAEVEARFAGGPVPRPPRWGGYRIVPAAIEFWRAGAGRLHDRERYVRGASGWTVEVLAP